ncbi:MAG: RNA polymerase sigma factor [Cytophagaceae bacterium]|nr:MAG: RNA polymerase sigma factor [Cytophagaceae bacterium]
MNAQLNDEELIRQYLLTNPDVCYETLYNRYIGKVYRRCLSLTKNVEKAEDYTQDIFMRTFARLDRFQERSSFSTWLYSISFNYCLEQIKWSNRLALTSLDDTLLDQYADVDEYASQDEQMRYLAQAMNTLSNQDADLLRMKYQQGLAIGQIAQVLDLKESAVKMRLKRSRDRVRQFCLITAY